MGFDWVRVGDLATLVNNSEVNLGWWLVFSTGLISCGLSSILGGLDSFFGLVDLGEIVSGLEMFVVDFELNLIEDSSDGLRLLLKLVSFGWLKLLMFGFVELGYAIDLISWLNLAVGLNKLGR